MAVLGFGRGLPPRLASTMPPARNNHAATLRRVRQILEETCEADGQGTNLQELVRRKSYRAGINRALAEIQRAETADDKTRRLAAQG